MSQEQFISPELSRLYEKAPKTPRPSKRSQTPITPSLSSPKENDYSDYEESSIDIAEVYRQRLGFEIQGLGEPGKPPYLYAALIGMSILTSDEKKLTLSQIYNWISSNFSHYKKSDMGWQNLIRHNLSLNKAFTKSERCKDGKGHYWQIEPGMESLFLKDRATKKASKSKRQRKKVPDAYQDLTPSSTFQQDEEDQTAETTDPAESSDLEHVVFRDILPQDLSLGLPGKKPNPVRQPRKRKQSDDSKENISFKKQDTFSNIPTLEAPASLWAASVSGESTTFVTTERPYSSLSAIDLSPDKGTTTGPILEPVTPRTILARSSLKTPNRPLRTPSTASVIRKIWSLPTYLQDFYTLPSNDGRSKSRLGSTVNSLAAALLAATHNGSPKKREMPEKSPRKLESSIIGNISTSYNDFFGVDICLVVKRAVESAVEKPKKKE